ncbi:putative colanic acid biosynthesis UDP-glucose lipid carrier transferase [Rhodopseudomonas julia]|uniref:Colanic acid biosynthesis UDP-glucose lipid carrier transferase n=1 Tax=Rhodopseudomonas julia TaxID=200617 RepID=A0ABU0C5S9_9BRAD|nr:sugar transferase [Rhodopseudomonas julia]MDQ0325875.1 putative colanic acid biosynthesis UDP-glucose lipid carrier transferase [Rhodopseudomonas julia]
MSELSDFEFASRPGNASASPGAMQDAAILPRGRPALVRVEACEIDSGGGNAHLLAPSKRATDIALALALIALFLPLMALIYVLVRITSRGPVIFRQERSGLRGRPFQIYKFRSMYFSTGEDFRQAGRSDRRVTPVGRVLRMTSADELPQFFNVLFGDMSIVGPRPHVASLDTAYASLVPGYLGRLQARPGITGLAQIRGQRGETPTAEAMQARVNSDLEYVRDASLFLDARILVVTVKHVLFSKDAY